MGQHEHQKPELSGHQVRGTANRYGHREHPSTGNPQCLPAPRLEENMEKSREVLQLLPELGVDIDQVTRQLEDEGIEKFNKPFDDLMASIEEKRAVVWG